MERDYFEIRRIFEDSDGSPIRDLCEETAKALCKKEWNGLDKLFDERFKQNKKDDFGADFHALINSMISSAFACGYVFGQEFDLYGEEERKLVGELKDTLDKEEILSFEARNKANRGTKERWIEKAIMKTHLLSMAIEGLGLPKEEEWPIISCHVEIRDILNGINKRKE